MSQEVKVMALGFLKAYLPEETTVAPNQTVGQVVEGLRLGTSEPILAVVNGRVVDWNYKLAPGDKLELVQGIGGG